MPNKNENDVNKENINEALNVTIPELFVETVWTYNLENRYQRHERLREECAKKFAKCGISDLFDSADYTGASLFYADNYEEKRLIENMMFLSLLNVSDDYFARDCCNLELENYHKDKQQQRVKASKPSLWAVTKLVAINAWPMIKRKQSIYQYLLVYRSVFMVLKEECLRKVFRRNKTIDSYQKYVKHRRNDFAADLVLVCMQDACKVSFDIKTVRHELLRNLHEVYLDLHWQSNDLFSFKKEFLNGEHSMNAITVLKNENNVSWQTAVEMLANIVVNTYGQLIDCIALINESELNIPDFYLKFLKESIELLGYCIKMSKRFQIQS